MKRIAGIPVFNFLFITFMLVALSTFGQSGSRVVRLAKLEIDANQLEAYKSALKEQIETAVKVEAGVLMLYAVAEKDDPASITVFEVYANESAYQAHLTTPHFRKYKETTKEMVKSLQLIPVDAVASAVKSW